MRVFRYLLGAALVMWAAGAFGQAVTVNGVIQDTDGNQWDNGFWKAQLVSPNGDPMYLGAPLSTTAFTGSLSSSGIMTSSGQFYATGTITPVGAFYEVSMCSATTAPCSKFNMIFADGTSLLAAVNAAIVAPRFVAFVGSLGYSDSELLLTPIVGARYFNSNTATFRYWTGTGWANEGGGGSPYNPAAVTITGGTINGTAIGSTTPAAGAFTSLSATNINGFTPLAGVNLFPVIVGEAYQPGLTGTSVNQVLYAAGTNPYLHGVYSIYCTLEASAITTSPAIVTGTVSYTDSVTQTLFSLTLSSPITLSITAPTLIGPVYLAASNATSITTSTVLITGAATFTKDCYIAAVNHH